MQLLDGDARRTVPTPGRGSRQCGPRPVLPDRYDALTRWFLDRDAGKEGLVSIGAAPARQRGPRARKGYSQFEQPPPVSGTRGGRRLLLAWPADRCQREPWTRRCCSYTDCSDVARRARVHMRGPCGTFRRRNSTRGSSLLPVMPSASSHPSPQISC